MVNMMGLFLEIIMNPIIIIAKSFEILKYCCLLGAQLFVFASATCLLLVKATIKVQVDACWNAIIWAVSIASLPFWVLSALHREKVLERKLHEMQTQLENLTWENKDLEERLDISFRECRVIETILAEVEEEQEKAVAKIDMLENELQELKDENAQLNEFRGKGLGDYQGQYGKGGGKVHDGIPLTNYSVPTWTSSYEGGGVVLHDILMHGDPWDNESKFKLMKQNLLGAGHVGGGSDQFPPQVALEGLVEVAALQRQRYVAVSRSIFSTILSLLVGLIIWEARDPCMPLVGALFTVVGVSLSSVVQFFSTIKNKQASDAVALLSFNWFILGTLTSPTLPRVARELAPPVLRFGNPVLSRLGFVS